MLAILCGPAATFRPTGFLIHYLRSLSCFQELVCARDHTGGNAIGFATLLIGQRHFHGASTNQRVPLLAVVNERTRRAGAYTTASSERHE